MNIDFEDRFDPQSVVHVAGMGLDYGGAPERIRTSDLCLRRKVLFGFFHTYQLLVMVERAQ